MAGLGHLGVGFAAKRIFPKIPLGILLVATYFIDIISMVLLIVGVGQLPSAGTMATSPWCHGLFMSVVWSVAAGLVAALISRNFRMSLGIGLVVFSHWVLDFITHPMGAVFGGKPLPPNLPLLFEGSPRVGLGLYNYSYVVVIITEFGLLIAGLGIYILTLRKTKQEKNK